MALEVRVDERVWNEGFEWCYATFGYEKRVLWEVSLVSPTVYLFRFYHGLDENLVVEFKLRFGG